MPVNSDNMTTCVRRFARRRKEGRDWMDYITGTKMAQSGNEVSFTTREQSGQFDVWDS